MREEIKKLRAIAKQKAEEEYKKEYLQKWKENTARFFNFVIAVKISLDMKKQLIDLCDKKKISISKYVRGLILKDLKGGLK